MKIVQTPDDLRELEQTNPAAYREQLVAILGASRVRMNLAEYPDDYDSTLEPGQDGYIAPEWTEVDDDSTLERLGFASRGEVEALLAQEADQ